jgi:CheY-like chemotaxis protein
MRRRVLVADDDAEVRAVIVEYLEQSGYIVTQADNGIEALRQLNTAPPDVLLLDLMMPRLGGLGALRLIVTPSQPGVRVIVITANEDPQLHAAAKALGAHAVVVKPLDLPELQRQIETLPAPDPSSRMATPSSTPADASGRPRILIVDDEPEIRALLREILETNGYATRSEESATGAFWAIMQETPDAVLLDIAMPGLSGIDIIPALRFVKQNVKIIMVSGVSDLGLAKQALAYGAFDYVTKPVDFMRLLEAVRAAVDASRAT